jgi:predicted AAA+ superfamily ATPase
MEIKRSIFNKLFCELREPQCLILVGPRQVGKTTLMLALEAESQRRGKKTRFLDLEQPADLALLKGDLFL